MELNFDKEIDSLLRQTAKGKSAFVDEIPNSNHLDADEISAFAENALPETAKQFYIVHLAYCDACRKNLSNLILLNAEAESENVHAEEIVPIPSATPWYRKLFAFPNLAYTLGALVVVFSGIIAFTIVQNVNNPQVSEVSQSSERSNDTKEMSADGDVVTSEISSANTANATSNANAAPFNSSNSMTANTSATNSAMDSNTSAVSNKPTVSLNAPPKNETRRTDDLALSKDKKVMSLDGMSAGSVSEQRQEVKKETERNAETADAAKPAPAPLKTAQPSVLDNQIKSDAQSARAKKNSLESKPETTSVGGKTFKRQNNVWYDAAYNGQSTTNITRGTDEYKKLDKDLRVIVENLGGTLVVVWKEKAYRIQ
ncbi:MAG: hypothetical protein M3Q33_01545 [Acidobacteriota bacterium]|nr:hypothetical protein [Acidobacteriota bacterium]